MLLAGMLAVTVGAGSLTACSTDGTSADAATDDSGSETTWTPSPSDEDFLRTISPQIDGTPEVLVHQADWICSQFEGDDSDRQFAIAATAIRVAQWSGLPEPEIDGGSMTMDQEVMNLTVDFWKKSAAAYCPEAYTADEDAESSDEGPKTSFVDGTYLVGSEIQPGTYRAQPEDSCYWERLSGLSGLSSDRIANEALHVSECVVDRGVGFGVAQHIGVLAGTR